jgi:uncharacterized membrane protein YeiH
VPAVFRGDLYATPALAGASITVVGTGLGFPVGVVAVLGGGVCLSWRLLAMWRHWGAPMPTGSASV